MDNLLQMITSAPPRSKQKWWERILTLPSKRAGRTLSPTADRRARLARWMQRHGHGAPSYCDGTVMDEQVGQGEAKRGSSLSPVTSLGRMLRPLRRLIGPDDSHGGARAGWPDKPSLISACLLLGSLGLCLCFQSAVSVQGDRGYQSQSLCDRVRLCISGRIEYADGLFLFWHSSVLLI